MSQLKLIPYKGCTSLQYTLGSVEFAFSFLVAVISVSALFVSAAEFDLEWSARLLASCSETVSVDTSDIATDFGNVCDLH